MIVLSGLSAHADTNDLQNYARAARTADRRIFLVHGEPDEQEPLRAALVESGLRVDVPERGDRGG